MGIDADYVGQIRFCGKLKNVLKIIYSAHCSIICTDRIKYICEGKDKIINDHCLFKSGKKLITALMKNLGNTATNEDSEYVILIDILWVICGMLVLLRYWYFVIHDNNKNSVTFHFLLLSSS